jgi:nitrite reductase/ring-hydroxylating ferredoxin subunit
VSGERIAIFRWDGRVAALSNVCQHQNGPLGEGRIVDGCVTCPWHGYQYRPEDGRSPPPFTEAVPTFAVRVERGRVLVATTPCAPGTVQTPATVPEGGA